jgi:hypothetical protein
VLLLGVLGAAVPRAFGADAGIAAISGTLDALVALERPAGGWAYRNPPGGRYQPLTFPVGLAERLAGPLGLVTWDVVVVRSPGTPAAGLALVAGYRLTGRGEYLEAARRAGDLLVAVQLDSGGWFSEMPVRERTLPWWFRRLVPSSTIDDDVTPGAVRFLLALWAMTGDLTYRRAAESGVAFLLRAQLPSGAWPRAWRPPWLRAVSTSHDDLATLNDGATTAAIETLLAGARTLDRDDLVAAARRGGDWLLRSRLPPPHAGWAQQYDGLDHPAPARRFEPAALSSWESRYAVDALLTLAAATGDQRYCAPLADAVRWLAAAALRPGCWARLYTLGGNEPLYVAGDGRRVATPREGYPTYSWTGDFGIPGLFARLGVRAAGGAGADVSEEPVAGDPGMCPGDAPHGFDRNAPDDPRALVARAALLLAARPPRAVSPCPGLAEAGQSPAHTFQSPL